MFNTLQLSALVGVTPDKDSPDSPRHQITPCPTLSLGLFSFSDMKCQIKMNADEKCLVNLFTWCKRANLDSLGMQKSILELIKIVYKIC